MIYERIKDLAKEKGVSIRQMECDLGLSERNTCKWNASLPKVTTLQKVAGYFGVPIEYFLEQGDDQDESVQKGE